MLQSLIEAAAVFVVIAGIAYLAGLGIASVAEQTVRRRLKADALGDRLLRLSQLQQRLHRRREELVPRIARLDGELRTAKRQAYMVGKRVSDTLMKRSRLLRVLGEEEAFQRPGRPARRFIAHVVNRHVQQAQAGQKELPNLARSWAESQRVDAWAATIGDAKAMVEKAFPVAIGFFIVDLREADQDPLADVVTVVAPPLPPSGREAGR